MPITISGSTGIAGVDGTVSVPAFQGTDTNTGIYYPAADQVAVSTNGTQAILATATSVTLGGNLSFNSGYGSSAVAYGCRAWVNFNGTGAVAIRSSGNVSSITDNGTGDYTVNFTNGMPDANYSVAATASAQTNYPAWGIATAHNTIPSTGSLRVFSGATGGSTILGYNADSAYVSVVIFR
jgi:hypothetical protein